MDEIKKDDRMFIENYVQLMWGEFNSIKNEYSIAPLILSFSLIEANAKLCAPASIKTSKDRFIWWVDKYLNKDEKRYDALELYGARCGLLHEYGAKSDLSRKGKCREIAWTEGGGSAHGKSKGNVIIFSKEIFFRDLNQAGIEVIRELKEDMDLQKRFAGRLKHIFGVQKIDDLI